MAKCMIPDLNLANRLRDFQVMMLQKAVTEDADLNTVNIKQLNRSGWGVYRKPLTMAIDHFVIRRLPTCNDVALPLQSNDQWRLTDNSSRSY